MLPGHRACSRDVIADVSAGVSLGETFVPRLKGDPNTLRTRSSEPARSAWPHLLVVDEGLDLVGSLERIQERYQVSVAHSAGEAAELVQQHRPDAMLLNLPVPDMAGLEALDLIRRLGRNLPVIVLTESLGAEAAIEVMKRGAFEFLLKPVSARDICDVADRALKLGLLNRATQTLDQATSPNEANDHIVGRSTPIQAVCKAIGRVASQDVPVLLEGETGTGKELVARAIFRHGARSQCAFVAINCAAIPDLLLESTLFGHERGAFTGADRRQIGKFEQADRGTIFLDEVGDMSSSTQAKVLRLLQDQCFERVGGSETIRTNVRIIAATNQSLTELVAAGRFRQDLFFRLNVFTILLPPLRKRIDDLPLLVDHFLRLFGSELGKHTRFLAPDTLALLQQYSWPGNVRELQSTIRHALVHATGDVLTPDHLPPHIHQASPGARPASEPLALHISRYVRELIDAGKRGIYHEVAAVADREVLREALKYVKGNQVQASDLLGISRTTLRARIQALGLTSENKRI